LEARGLSSVAAGSYHLRANSLCPQCEVSTKDGPRGTNLPSEQGTKMGAVVQAEMGVTSVVVPEAGHIEFLNQSAFLSFATALLVFRTKTRWECQGGSLSPQSNLWKSETLLSYSKGMQRRSKIRIQEAFPVTVRGVDRNGQEFLTDTVLDNLS